MKTVVRNGAGLVIGLTGVVLLGLGSDRVALIRRLAERWSAGALSTERFEAGKRSIMLAEQADRSER